MPGAMDNVWWMLDYTNMRAFAKEKGFAFLSFEGFDAGQGLKFNIGLGAQPVAGGVNDIDFVRPVLQEILDQPCIDHSHIHCAGWSNGGRFCAYLASEMSEIIASVGLVSSLRFPKPNHATRSVPILAFHGTADTVNPWAGNGDPTYWNESVPSAFARWVDFNGCSRRSDLFEWEHLRGEAYRTQPQTNCKDDAIVQLVKLEGFNHPWPGCDDKLEPHRLGPCNHDVSANDMMWQFFQDHPMPMHQQRLLMGKWLAVRKLLWSRPPSALAAAGAVLIVFIAAACGLRRQQPTPHLIVESHPLLQTT